MRARRSALTGPKWARDLPEVAQIYAGLWARGVARQYDRVAEGGEDLEGQLLDALLYVVCLRDLLRSADLVRDALPEKHARHVVGALERFKARCPKVVAARNVLEHFDDHVLGHGRVQRSRAKTPLRLGVVRKDDRYVLRLVLSGTVVAIDMRAATDAAFDLWLDLVEVQDIADEGEILATEPDDDVETD